MNRALTTKFSITDRKVVFVLTLLVLVFIVLTLSQDFLRSNLKNSAFYFSESFIFSSFWWLFAPLLFTQYIAITKIISTRLYFYLSIILLPIMVHLVAFPFLVWTITEIFYYHTYSFQQTFRYILSEHLYLLVLLYSIPFLASQ